MRLNFSNEVFYVYAARAARGFGDGFVVIILPAYLTEIGFEPFGVGIIATAALLGTAITTLAAGFLGKHYELRKLLLITAFVMLATGVAIPNFEHLALLVPIVFLGTINPQAGEIGMMVPLEQAVLARDARDEDRTGIFSRYSLSGDLATAAGTLAAAMPDALISFGFSKIGSLKAMFYLYAVFGLLSAVFYRALPAGRSEEARAQAALGRSRWIVYKLTALFSLDAFGGGFAVQSLVALWLFQRFGVSLSAVSIFFFCTNILNAFSYLVATRIAKRVGLVNTMVFTHIPSNLCLIIAAVVPSLPVVLAVLLIRAALSQMDVPTRTSYVMAVVTPAERPAAAGITAAPRSLALSVGPALSGALLGTGFSGLPFVICGVLKTVYDLTLLFGFRHIKPPEEQDLPSNDSGVPNRWHDGQQSSCRNRFNSGGMER
jgi:MFS family permease